MPLIEFALNLSWIYALLIGPLAWFVARAYRKNFLKAIIVWRTPDSLLLTVIYFISTLLLLIVGMACFFNYLKEANPQLIAKYRDLTFICVNLWLGSTGLFIALRMLLVQVLMREGLMLNHFFFRIPIPSRILQWEQICDYYTQNDYPSIIFQIIYRAEGLKFKKVAISTPSHLQVFLKETLEASLDGEQEMPFYLFGRRKGVSE